MWLLSILCSLFTITNKKAVRVTGTASRFKRSETNAYPRRASISIRTPILGALAMVIVTIGEERVIMDVILGFGKGFVNEVLTLDEESSWR